MASINSLGAGSGVLTSDLVDKIIVAERKATDLRLETKKAQANAKLSAVGSVRSAIAKVESAVTALRDPGAFGATTASVSDTKVASVTTNSTAEVGTHTIEVQSLAKSQTLRSRTFSSLTDTVGTGTLSFRFGTTTLTGGGAYDDFVVDAEHPGGSVVINTTNNTLGGVRDAVNAANLGVKARVVDDGGGFRLVFTSTQAGAKNSVEISVDAGASVELSALAYNKTSSTEGTNLSQTIAASDAVVNIDGIPVRRTSNSISGVADGLTFNITETNVGNPATVTVNRNTSSASAKVQAFVDAYNGLKSLADSLTVYDAKKKTAGVLLGDPTLRTVLTQLRRSFTGIVSDLPATGVRALADVGVTTDQNNSFKLSFDSTRFVDALNSSPESVKGLFASTSKASDALISIVNPGARSVGGRYDVQVARMATQATLAGAAVPALAGPVTIDASNDTLTVDVDGASSGTLTLTQGTFGSAATVASDLQEKINADAVLRGSGATVTVSFDSTANAFVLRSTRFGSTSQIGISSVDTNTAASLGLSVQAANVNKGLNAVGSVNGVQALGTGQVLTVTSTAPSASTGRFVGTQIGRAPIVIDGTNKTLTARVDGVTTGSVSLTEASYATGAALATELQTRINADANLTAQKKRVTVSYDEGGRYFTLFTTSTGVASEVALTAVPAATSSTLGLTVGDGLRGHPGATRPDKVSGAQLRVLGGATGARGTFEVVRGLMHQLSGVFTGVLSTGGSIDTQLDGLNDQLGAIDAEKAKFDTHITALESRLRLQFANADRAISQLNSTSTFLTAQLSSLTNQRNN